MDIYISKLENYRIKKRREERIQQFKQKILRMFTFSSEGKKEISKDHVVIVDVKLLSYLIDL